ncbi:hypothetical protein F5Y13DRAFT_98328 [Hypoxylon sp. FL1857]|nr:hypothetical protein F5Y13DRAFT_98328 [Hypoxylon sp. FL1857]
MATHDYPYKKGVNITAWVLQFLVCIILLAASAWLLWLVNSEDVLESYSGLFTVAAGLQIAIVLVNIIMNILEIILIAKKRMPVELFLSSACIKTAVWGIIFILDVVTLSVISIILTLVLTATSLLQLIHGAILVHRKRRGTLRGGKYAPTENPSAGLMEAQYGAPQAGYYNPGVSTEYKSPSPVASPAPPQYGYAAPAYAPQATGGSYELDSRPQHA